MKRWWVALVLAACMLGWSATGVGGGFLEAVNGLPCVIDYVSGMWPPDLRILPSLVSPLIETIQMGFLGVIMASVISAPLSFLAARETSLCNVTYILSKLIINVCRSIPTLLWAILFVTMVGLGPSAGVFALTVHCVGALGKYFHEGIESIYPRVRDMLDAMEVDGASRTMAFILGLVPAVSPLFLSYIIYYMEWSVRVGTILGLVGAGGLGLRLTMSIRMFRRQETCTIILAIFVMVMIIDALSRAARKSLLQETL